MKYVPDAKKIEKIKRMLANVQMKPRINRVSKTIESVIMR